MVAEIMTPEKCVFFPPTSCTILYSTCLTYSAQLRIILEPVGNPSHSQEASSWPLQNDFREIVTSFYSLMLSKYCKIIETKNVSSRQYVFGDKFMYL